MYYVNLTGIYDVKYIMYDNLLELVFDRIKKSKVRVLTNEQEIKVKLNNGDHELFDKIGKLQEKLSSLQSEYTRTVNEEREKFEGLHIKQRQFSNRMQDLQHDHEILTRNYNNARNRYRKTNV